MTGDIKISEYNYTLPEERIARFPLECRERSKQLIYKGSKISEDIFYNVEKHLPAGSMLVFNNTKVIRARLIFHKETGARIEIFCLEPYSPADYERAFAVRGSCEWKCIVGNLKKWKEGKLFISADIDGLRVELSAERVEKGSVKTGDTETDGAAGDGAAGSGIEGNNSHVVKFEWNGGLTFGQLLEKLGRIPIPPYLCRESEESDNSRYQTVYSMFEGSVAAPTAGLHFTPKIIDGLKAEGHPVGEVTLHVGAGTFLPVKCDNAADHSMHTEHFEVTLPTVEDLVKNHDNIIAVGTTSVRTLESLCGLGYRIVKNGDPDADDPVGQYELYDIPERYGGRELLSALAEYMSAHGIEKLKAATRIMIMPDYRFRVVNGIITNFHQPQSTLLLLVSAFVGDDWRRIYDHALSNGFRFLSYGDSSLLLP